VQTKKGKRGGKKRKKTTNLQEEEEEEEEEEGKKKVTVANKEKSTCVVSYQWRETLRENAAGMSANASGT
jgi:translation elongation factor P/translation initiation factor 5A